MNKTENLSKDPKEFYENSNSYEVSMCEHFFTRLTSTRVQCKKCGLGFFDNPFDPFPIDEINRGTINERARQNYSKRKKKDVENKE